MRHRTIATILLSSLALITCWSPLSAQDDDEQAIKKRKPTRFLRIEQDEFDEPVALQTATAKYVLKDDNGEVKLEVYLEGVVHIGDAAYYRGFNRRFKHYDAVLYELIAPKERRIPDLEIGKKHPLRLLQQVAGEGLGFAHQIEEIDYKAGNMVHSDLSIQEMAAAREKRGEDEFTMLADMVLHALRKMNRESLSDDDEPKEKKKPKLLDFDILSDPEGGVKIRRVLARSIGGDSPESSLFPAQAATLINDRNERAMSVLQKQLDAGKRRIALFWGAAHMPDFEQRLMLDYGMELASVNWRSAWDLRDGAVELAPLEAILEKSLRSAFDDVLDELRKKSRRNEDDDRDDDE